MIERLQAQMQAMQMLTKMQDITANNLANINTPGFKRSNVFYQMVQQEVGGEMISRTVPHQQIDMSQGVLEPTNNPLDFGIKGKGFFVVAGENSRLLSRDGRMHVNADGYLVDGQGKKVMGSAGPIFMPDYLKATGEKGDVKLEVAEDGTIRLNSEMLDKMKIVNVEDTSDLERMGNNYFSAPANLLVESQSSSIKQGYYESGNVNPLDEMVDMMKTSKMFETQQRAIRTTDELLGQATSNLGKF